MTNYATMTINTPQQSNKPTFADLMAAATALGTDAGKGKDTQVKFLLKLIEAGYHNTIDLESDKHGKEIDDATKLAETYVKAQGSAVVFDAKAPNQRKLVSCLRTGIKLGQWPKGGPGEPLATVNQLVSIRQKLRADPTQVKKLDDAFNTVLKYARHQLKQDQLIEEAGLKRFCFRDHQPNKTAEELIAEHLKGLRALVAGKAANGTAQDNSKHVQDAVKALNTRLAEIVAKRATTSPKAGKKAA